MKPMRYWLILLLAAAGAGAADTAHWAPPVREGDLQAGQVDATINQLDDPASRLRAYGKLLRFSQLYNAQMGSGVDGNMYEYLQNHPDVDAAAKRAKGAIAKVPVDAALVKEGLSVNDAFLNGWAIRTVETMYLAAPSSEPRDPQLMALVPMVRDFAKSNDEQLRHDAEQTLEVFPTERGLIDSLVESETSPENIMFLIRASPTDVYSKRMSSQLVRLLGNGNEEVRSRAAGFIAFNHNMAPMYHCNFDEEVIDSLIELAGSEFHRAIAVEGLASIYDVDAGKVLPILSRMAEDKDQAVRLQLAMNLRGSDPRAREILLKLYHDSDDEVRYFAILGLGMENYVDDLKALAKSSNTEVAGFATGSLTRIEQERAQRQN